jgi:hypothetical protein
MPADQTILRVQCTPPTKEYFSVVLVLVASGFLTSAFSDPHQWLIDAAIAASTMMILAAFWFWVFLPHQSKRIYVVDLHTFGIERSGKTLESVPRHEIEAVSDLGVAVRIARFNARPILLYPGEQKDALLKALG